MRTPTSSPTFWSALLGIGMDGSPWQYMLSMRADGYGGVTKVPLGPFGGDYYFLLEPDALKTALLEDADEFFPRRFSVPLFAALELDKGIVYEQGQRHRRQKRLCDGRQKRLHDRWQKRLRDGRQKRLRDR